MEIFTPNNITFAIGIMGVIFGIYQYFRNPQIDQDKRDALLAQQVKWQSEATEKRFQDIQESFKSLLLQSNNHIHTVDTKVDVLAKKTGDVEIALARLSTIIEERIPKK
jgi:hypothetical protein